MTRHAGALRQITVLATTCAAALSCASQQSGSVLHWLSKAEASGRPLVVAVDEPGDHRHGLVTDREDLQHDDARKNALWGTLLAGGARIMLRPPGALAGGDWIAFLRSN